MTDTLAAEVVHVDEGLGTLDMLADLGREAFSVAWEGLSAPERQAVSVDIDRLARAREDPTPGHLAQRLDPTTVQTPALMLIDEQLVAVRDAIAVMFKRRRYFSQLVLEGVDKAEAAERAGSEIPDAGATRLIISLGPQEGKSTRCSRYGLLWLLRQFPTLRIGLVSYDGTNAAQFSYQIRSDIELFNGTGGQVDLGLRLAPDQRAMGRFQLATGGGIYAIGIGGGLSGRPLDLLHIDDPVKDMEAADSTIQSEKAWSWWDTVGRPRLAPWAPTEMITIRWSETDLAGRMKTREQEAIDSGMKLLSRWRIINIPAKADHDPNKGETDLLGREPGEFLVSARGRTRAQWEQLEWETPARDWNALYQGNPTSDVGDVLERDWWRRYDTPLWIQQTDGSFDCPGFDLSQSWDFAFKDTDASDYVVGQVYAKKSATSYLVYSIRKRLSFTATIDEVRRVTALFPRARRKFIEDKANGPAVIDSLQHEIPGIIPSTPTTSKVARARAASPYARAGNVQLPTMRVALMEPALAFDVDSFVEEATDFPRGTHDDQVDCFSQYVFEAYIVGGIAVASAPQGDLSRGEMAGRTESKPRQTEIERRLAARAG